MESNKELMMAKKELEMEGDKSCCATLFNIK